MNAESALTTSNTPPESRATENSVENLLAVDDQEGSWLTSNATTGNTNTNLMDEEGGEAMATDDTTIPPTSTASSTAYAFTGSALGGGSTDNLNQKKPPSAAGGSSAAAPGGSEATGDGDKSEDTIFECNICLDTAKDAVVSMCGHLYCWPCLHQWLETRPHRKLCPVCKAAISKEKVIPLYGRNSSKQDDPRYIFHVAYFFYHYIFRDYHFWKLNITGTRCLPVPPVIVLSLNPNVDSKASVSGTVFICPSELVLFHSGILLHP